MLMHILLWIGGQSGMPVTHLKEQVMRPSAVERTAFCGEEAGQKSFEQGGGHWNSGIGEV
jgi:hypothetical protein